MKLLLPLLPVILVFTVDCLGFPDEPDGRDSADEAQLLEKASAIISDIPKPQLELQVSEEEMFSDDWKSAAERGACSPIISCTLAGGYCIKRRQTCNGTKDPRGCRGRQCICCIPETIPVTCPVVTSTPCPTKATTPRDVETTLAPSTTPPVPGGFEKLDDGRMIRRTISSDTKCNYDDCMAFCSQFEARPFIPRSEADYQLYKEARAQFTVSQWLPANDRQQEGTLRWYNSEVALNISLWDWHSGQVLQFNSEISDCLFYGTGPRVYMVPCSLVRLPPICEKL